MPTKTIEHLIKLNYPHPRQMEFVRSRAKRRIVRAGRRAGKTEGASNIAVEGLLAGRRILYATPTQEQIERFWANVKRALQDPIDAGLYYKNETLHLIERPGTDNRIRAKTAWDADSLRGDYADIILLDEFQLMNEEAWDRVGAPMLLDNNGDAIFIYTPPSLRSRSASKARDPMHAAKMFKAAEADTTGRWATFHWSSHDNPHISKAALADIIADMTSLGYRQEIMAEDVDEAPGALWKRSWLDENRIMTAPDDMSRIVVAIDPAVTSAESSNETGIVVCGRRGDEGYLLADASGHYTPGGWARKALALYIQWKADRIVAESNNGGEMVEYTLGTVDPSAPVKLLHASRGKAARAEPVAALYEQNKIKHVGHYPDLEDQLCTWSPLDGNRSPDRLDAATWGFTELMLGGSGMKIWA